MLKMRVDITIATKRFDQIKAKPDGANFQLDGQHYRKEGMTHSGDGIQVQPLKCRGGAASDFHSPAVLRTEDTALRKTIKQNLGR